MSMEYSFYVGPFLKITPQVNLYDLLGDALTDGLGEIDLKDNSTYAVPNRKVKEIDRKTMFSPNDLEQNVVRILNSTNEQWYFRCEFAEEIEKISDTSAEFSVQWGIVPRFS